MPIRVLIITVIAFVLSLTQAQAACLTLEATILHQAFG